MDPIEFLRTVVTTPKGWFCLALRNNGKWNHVYFQWPNDVEQIVKAAADHTDTHDVYFSSYLSSKQSARKQDILPTNTIQADLDEASLQDIPITPSVLVETSPGRHQGYWLLSGEPSSTHDHEQLSRSLTYNIPRCDRSGWALGRKVRFPGTLNHKYKTPFNVHVIIATGRQYDPKSLPPAVPPTDDDVTDEWMPAGIKEGPRALLEILRPNIPPRVYSQYDTASRDRSGYIWGLMLHSFRAGMNRDQVYVLVKGTINNKFNDLRVPTVANAALVADIQRAYLRSKRPVPPRAKITDARKLPGPAHEKRAYMAALVLSHLQSTGNLIRTDTNEHFIVLRDTGQPIPVLRRSDALNALFDVEFGLNAAESEHTYIVNHLISHITNLPVVTHLTTLSYYSGGDSIFIHTGGKDVLHITPSGVQCVTNGNTPILFQWGVCQVFDPTVSPRPWIDELIGDSVDTVSNMSPEEARAVLAAWFVFMLLRSGVMSRPILSFIGQPGAGKSTLLKRISTIIYGPNKSILTITNPEDFDHQMSTFPLLIIDNVDSFYNWLPDRLALSAAPSEILKRKLYTDADTITLKRQALIALSAHDPKFNREDVNDRMILLIFERRPYFATDTGILQGLAQKRSAVWASIINDLHTLVKTPKPTLIETPQFRIEDFAYLGLWIARALGFEPAFRSGMEAVQRGQASLTLESEHLLIDAMQAFVSSNNTGEGFQTASYWWSILEDLSTNPLQFTKQYRNPLRLARKMWTAQNTLKQVFQVDWKYDPTTGTRLWRFGKHAGA